jgi:hypothetical protein
MLSTRYSYQILKNLEFSSKSSKSNQTSNFMNIRPVGSELFHAERQANGQADGRTDMTLIVDFVNFAKAPENGKCMSSKLKQRAWNIDQSYFSCSKDESAISRRGQIVPQTNTTSVNLFTYAATTSGVIVKNFGITL